MSERIKYILSLLRVLLNIVGFYVSRASSFPLVQRLISPPYAAAKSGIEAIRRNGSLQAGQPGFAALAALIEPKIASQNPQAPYEAIILQKLEATGGGIAFGPAVSKPVVGLKMTLRHQEQPLQSDLVELSDAVGAP